MSLVQEVVAKGAGLLDEKRPGWAAEINVDELRITSWRCCILGQLYGGYGNALELLAGLDAHGSEFGFDTSWGKNLEPELLELAWRAEIADRLSGEEAAS